MRKLETTRKFTEKVKLGDNWDGPFKTTRVTKPGTFELENLEGKNLQCQWHTDHLKKYLI